MMSQLYIHYVSIICSVYNIIIMNQIDVLVVAELCLLSRQNLIHIKTMRPMIANAARNPKACMHVVKWKLYNTHVAVINDT